MALFRPILTTKDLPPIGTGRENGTLDFKQTVDPTNQRELAKDIAAFANSLGGAILVGAVENSNTGNVGAYIPLTLTMAQMIRDKYELAANQRCEPSPVVEAVRIETDSTLPPGHVIAVNVYPIAMGPVGVRGDDHCFSFPVRLTSHTYFLRPAELAMLMVPEIRRIAIVLDSIPPSERTDAVLYYATGTGMASAAVDFLGIDDRFTTARFVLSTNRHVPGAESALPLDRIRSAWRMSDTQWAIGISGSIDIRGRTFIFLPK